MQRLPGKREGYALDLDSTRLLHEDGHPEGVEIGYPRVGTKPCLHPLPATFSEVRLVAAPGPNHDQTRRAAARTQLVAKILGEIAPAES
ncbi:MAG: hypothetical protein HY736_02955 [Verrucomicrobia bacterium]|nr:hypothetical protein [Verrucomicrobiota bacterium]